VYSANVRNQNWSRTVAVLTAIVAIDQEYVHGSVSHGRAISRLIGGGIWLIFLGAVLVILDTGNWQRYIDNH
jgi:hypothetical protein